jgi:asparagine synthase (glutamine-hydrolysing)
MDEHQNRRANWGYHLWGLLMLVLWMKRWKVEAPPANEVVLASPGEAILAEPPLLWQPASYFAQTS